MMFNEFFKSIFRTLGRICAYIILGIIAYFIFSWFDKGVEAQTIDVNTYHIQAINTSNQVVQNEFLTDELATTNNNIITQYFWYPMDSNWNYIGINQGDYSIEIYFYIKYEDIYQNQNDLSLHNFLPSSYKMVVGSNNLTATCDGTQGLDMYDMTYDSQNNQWYLNYKYTCSLLNVTQNFNKFGFNVKFDYLNNHNYTTFTYINIGRNLINDLNMTNNDTSIIINNNNQNTQNIITNNNQNTQQITNAQNETTEAVDEIKSYLNSDVPSDTSILFDIEDYMPDDTPLTNLLFLPINVLQASYNGINGTCQAWTIPFGSYFDNYNLTLPCINLAHMLGDQSSFSWQGYNLWEIIDFMFSIFMIYNIAMLIIHAYSKIASLDDPWEEVYVPRHIPSGRSSRYVEY